MRYAKLIFFGSLLVMLLIGTTQTGAVDPPRPAKAEADDSGGITRTSPRNSGDANPAYWGHLTEDQEVAAVSQLKKFAEDAADKLKRPLRLQESRFFLFYSDLGEIESTRFSSLLERMYARMLDLFGLPKGENLWRGKALFFAFSRIEDYRLYERLVENNDPGESFAITHCFGDGMVHTAFFRYPDQAEFEHLLVHESVHGFLHRYRTPARVPSWANEGLADEAAAELIFNPKRGPFMLDLVKKGLEKHKGSVGDFFTARHIDGWQYPIAETLAAWMIHQNRQRYLDFINGIKDGQTWDESLKKNFKMPPDKLLAEYGKAIGVKTIKM
jgi:hypothetical protein